MNTRKIGELGEQIACAFLSLKGYEILKRNYRFAGREIDLVARTGGFLVAVEVKLRRGTRFGRAVEAVDRRKLERIQVALGGAASAMGRSMRPRVDLVVIDFDNGSTEMTVRHIKGVS